MSNKIVFVTPELFPFDTGGIGRVIANILETASVEQRKHMAIAHLKGNLTQGRFQSVYPEVGWIDAGPDQYQETDEHGNRYPSLRAYSDGSLHAESVRVMQVLKRFEEQNGAPAYIEFPDWNATGFACIQEKKLGLAFQKTCLAVRLHSTDSMLGALESRYTNEHLIALYDLERKALSDADMIVAQLPGVAREVRQFFDLDEAEWLPRLRIHAPPVLLDNMVPATKTVGVTLDTPIVFSSKIQGIKRPETFVRACCGFLNEHPDYRGQVILIAHAFHPSYLASVKALIAPELAHRFLFIPSATSVERQKIISGSVCVLSTVFESFCLAAYEASMAGALCVVNGSNPAFNGSSPWIDGQNCEKFDGSAADLHRALRHVFESAPSPLQPIQAPCDPWPWLSLPAIGERLDASPVVSVLITHFNSGMYLEETLDSVLASDYSNLEIVIVDEASTEPVSRALIERLGTVADERFRITRLAQGVGKGAARNIGLQIARGEFVLCLDAQDVIHPSFISRAAWALVHNRAHDFVVPQTAYFDTERSALSASAPKAFSVLIGEARASGLHRNFFSMGATFARRTVLQALRYNEALTEHEDWELCLRAVSSGHRFIVTNSVQFYRRRNNVDAAATLIPNYAELRYQDVLRNQHLQFGQIRIPLYAVCSGDPIQGAENRTDEELRAQLEFYENSRVVFAALAVARRLRTSAPWALRWARGAAKLAWLTWKRMKGS